jgi:hypothetical protein
MRPGPRPAPQRKLARTFIDAITHDGREIQELAKLSRFRFSSKLSPMLQGRTFAATPLNLDRLAILAVVVGFDGKVLDEDAA